MSDLLKLQMVAMEATRNLGFEQGVKTERERVFSLSVNEFLVEKLNYKIENKTVCVEQPVSLDEREMKLMDWTDFRSKGDE